MAYASVHHLSTRFLPFYLRFLREYRPEMVMGQPSALATIAHFALENDDLPAPATAVFTTAEAVTEQARQVIESAWQCRVWDGYGASEGCVYASQCEQGRYHVSPEIGIVEILDSNGRNCSAGELGEIVCTGLQNTLQPLVRYRIGDAARWAPEQKCSCGRSMPILEGIEGRHEDTCVTADGRPVVRFDPVFRGLGSIVEAQVIQEEPDSFRVLVVPAKHFDAVKHAQAIVENMHLHVGGSAKIEVTVVSQIPRTSSGKFQAVVCRLSEEEKRRLLSIDAMGRSATSPHHAVFIERGPALSEQGRSRSLSSARFSNMPGLVGLYHALPPSLRSLAATLQGHRLSTLRYCAQSDLLAVEALERDTWSLARWRTWQDERLGHILRRAVASVPYYREQWAERRRRGDKASSDAIKDWPVLKKDALRQDPRAFLADGCLARTMHCEHTSGTTGTPIHLWRSRDSVRAWYALCEARQRRWNGLTRHDRWANIGGQLVTPIAQRRPPFWVWNAPMRQLYMSSYHLAGDLIPFYLDALEKYRVKYIIGYPSSRPNALPANCISGPRPGFSRCLTGTRTARFRPALRGG
jgi:phenylacetate-coenzyme A ligase PaaK-like adenylate-forming protein